MVSLKLSNIYETLFPVELVLDRNSLKRDAERRLVGAVDVLRESCGHKTIFRGYDLALRKARPTPPAPHRKLKFPCRKESLPGHYLPLNVQSYYSFLASTLSIEAIVNLAKQHGLPAIALADENNLHGAAELVTAAQGRDKTNPWRQDKSWQFACPALCRIKTGLC